MSIPFEVPDKNKRKYQCFVCGKLFDNYPEYKEHVVEKHEEIREYILCPLARCQAPVRDLKLHFKVHHRTEDFKKVKGPTRSLIWKDFTPKGRGKTRKPKFRQGSYTSTKTGRELHYRSGWEEQVYQLLDQDKEVVDFVAEPFQFDYIHKGKARKYTPDLFITFIDDRKEVWEIKPAKQTLSEQNQNKWHYAEKACECRGWKFETVTEVFIDRLKKKVQRQQALGN